MTLTRSELMILGLLIEEPGHGYQLEQVIERRGIRRWVDVGFSSIYYVLRRLEDRGLVASEADGERRSRRRFRATRAGREEAAIAVSAVLTSSTAPHPLLLGLANAGLVDEQHFRDALRLRRRHVDERIASVTAAQRAQAPSSEPACDVFGFSLALLEAERAWLAVRTEERS